MESEQQPDESITSLRDAKRAICERGAPESAVCERGAPKRAICVRRAKESAICEQIARFEQHVLSHSWAV